jgi:RND family efflux transporter MFP subunit
MKLPVKWIAAALVVALLAVGVLRALAAREATAQALAAQLASRKAQASVELAAGDVLRAQSVELMQVLPVSGTLKAVRSAFVKARVAGELQELRVREGDNVRAGQVLARIDTTEYTARQRQAQQQAEAAKSQVDIARRSLDNNQALVDQGFISRTALDTSLNNLAAAQASYKAAQAATDLTTKALDDTVLRAPIAGQIAQRLVQSGERVAVDARIVEVVDVSALELEAAVAAADSVRVQVGQRAQLTIEGLAQPLQARVLRINPSVIAGSRSVLVYFAIPPTAGLHHGLFAQGTLGTGSFTALAVPLDAVRTDKPQPYVQQIVNNTVAHQSVRLGAAGEAQGVAMVEVKDLASGAEVLAGKLGALREGTVVQRAAGKP